MGSVEEAPGSPGSEAGPRPLVSVVVPAYDEEQAIASVLVALQETLGPSHDTGREWDYEIIVVNDGSSDGTGAAARTVPGIRVIDHRRNRGYGASLKTGIRHSAGSIIVITDADGTYPARYIAQLVADTLTGDCDMAVGARTGEYVKIPALRKPAKWFLTRLASFLAETQIPDLNSGLRAFRKESLLPFLSLLPSGFSFTTTITLAMLCSDLCVDYLPIDYHARQGKSKIRPLRDTYNFILLVVKTICYFNPLKVFLPPSLLLVVAGAIRLMYDLLVIHKVAGTETVLLLSGIQLGAIGLLADVVSKVRLMPRSG
jgi:glycosyltransferase involved in cell wall biosynthesis